MTGFLALELRRSLRDVRYLVIAVAMPIGLYLLFTGLFGAHGQRALGLPQPVELMVAMIAYGAMWAVFSATGPRVTLQSSDTDATVRSLVGSGLAWSGLEVGGPDLEASFLRLLGEAS